MIDARVMEETARRLKGIERRLEDTTRRETGFVNVLKAWHYNNDLAEVFDRAEALSGNVRIDLQPGTTYTLSAGIEWTSETHGLTVVGNGATISVADGITYAIRFITCTGRYYFENVNFTAATDTSSSALVGLRIEGVDALLVWNCDFRYFGGAAISSNNNTTELLHVWRTDFHELGNTRNGGADVGIGITPAYVRNMTVRDCGFWEIGTTNNDHGIYGHRGPATGVAVWMVENCRFGADMFSDIYFREDSGEIGTAIIKGCELNAQVTINCTDLVFTGNHLSPAYVRVETPDTITVTGNYFTSTSTGTSMQILSLNVGGVIAGNTFYNCNTALSKTGTGDLVGLAMHDNIVLLCDEDAVRIEAGSGFTMTNCTFMNNSIEATRYCYYIAADTLNCVISGTHRIGTGSEFLRLDATNTELHVHSNDASGSISHSGATLTNCLIESPYDNTTPSLNLFQFADGDTTPSVAVGSYFQENYTNPTDITAFDDAVDGKMWTVKCLSGNVTLRFDTGSLIGEGSASYATSAGDVLFCQKVGSNTAITIAKV